MAQWCKIFIFFAVISMAIYNIGYAKDVACTIYFGSQSNRVAPGAFSWNVNALKKTKNYRQDIEKIISFAATIDQNAKNYKEECSRQQKIQSELAAEVCIVQEQDRIRQYHAQVRANVDIQYNEVLHQLCYYWHSHYTIPRLHNRAQALYSILNKSESYTTKGYRLNSEFKKLHRHNSGLLEDLSECYGNALQHVLHQEFVDIANRSSEETINLYMNSHFEDVMPQAIELGLQANKAGFIEQSSKLADICWAMIDVAKAISEGVVEGGKEVCTMAYNICIHPIQTTGDLLTSIATLGHVMAQAVGVVNELFYYYVTDYEKFYLRQHEIVDFLIELGYQTNKKITSRVLIKKTSKLITETVLFHGIGTVIKTICKKAVQIVPIIIKKNEPEKLYALINMPSMESAPTKLMGMETSLASSVAPVMHKNIAKVSYLLDDCAHPISKFLFDLEKKVPA